MSSSRQRAVDKMLTTSEQHWGLATGSALLESSRERRRPQDLDPHRSLENFRINVERGFDVIGFKERRRRQAEEFEPGDEIFFYVTGVQAFGGIARVSSEMFEDRTPIWPGRERKGRSRSPTPGGSRPSRS